MDERRAEQLLYVDAALTEMSQLAARGRRAYDSDIAVARASQYNIIRLAASLERLGKAWLDSHPDVPWRLIRGMRNRIAHDYWTVDDDIVWDVIEKHAPALRNVLADEVATARSVLRTADESGSSGH